MEKAESKDTNETKTNNDEIADFEKAMHTAGFGIYNYYMLLVMAFGSLANNFETTTMSFIVPVAECDLKLTLRDKGTLNAATYAGMILSALFWGYLADTKGRKKLLIICYLSDAVCVLGSSLSQNVETLIAFKFIGGIMINGPSAILYTYFAELHSSKHRDRIVMFLGSAMTCGTLLLPILAWAIFPQDWDFVLFGLNVHSWQIYLIVCSLPSLISGVLIMLLPESPKFLMSQGRNTEALRAFQKIYAINKRQSRENYPIKELIEEVPSRESKPNEAIYTIDTEISNGKTVNTKKPKLQHRSLSQALRDGVEQVKPMFRKPLLSFSIFIYLLHFTILLGLNTIRLWLPQLFASFTEYESLYLSEGESANLCKILEFSVNKTAAVVGNDPDNCLNPQDVSIDMYINNIIVSVSGVVGYVLGGYIVKAIGAKMLMITGMFTSACLGLALYWANNSTTTLAISSAYLTVASVSTMSLLGTVVALFPTSLRTIIVASSLMFGRFGALSGNILFPILVEMGCIPPFLMVGTTMLAASALSFLLPSAKKLTFT